MNIGDAVEKVAKPIAKALDLPCLDDTGALKPNSPCAKRRDALNNLGSAAYDFLWSLTGKKNSMAQYIVTKIKTVTEQIAVDADDVDKAEDLARAGKGTPIARNSNEQFNVTQRPVPSQPTPQSTGQAQAASRRPA